MISLYRGQSVPREKHGTGHQTKAKLKLAKEEDSWSTSEPALKYNRTIEHPELPSTQEECNKRTRVAALDNLNLRSRKILSAVIHDHGSTSYNKLSLGSLYLRRKKIGR